MKIFSSQVLAQGLRVLLLNDFQFNKKTRATGAGLVAPKGIKPLSQVPETCILFVELRSRNIIQSLNRYPRRLLGSSNGVCHRHLPP